MDETTTQPAPERLARFHVSVHASNRHAGLGTSMTILAATRQEAVERALDLGGYLDANRRYGRVTIRSVEDVHPRECPSVVAAVSS